MAQACPNNSRVVNSLQRMTLVSRVQYIGQESSYVSQKQSGCFHLRRSRSSCWIEPRFNQPQARRDICGVSGMGFLAAA